MKASQLLLISAQSSPNPLCKLLTHSSSWPGAPKYKDGLSFEPVNIMLRNKCESLFLYCEPAGESPPSAWPQQLPPAARGLAGQSQSCKKNALHQAWQSRMFNTWQKDSSSQQRWAEH